MAGENERRESFEFSNPQTGCAINLCSLRERIRNYIDKHHYDTALFWADKLVSISNGCVEDVYWYAQALYHTGQYHRAAHLLKTRKLDKGHASCRYLAAKCHYECKEYQEALDTLDLVDNKALGPKQLNFSISIADASDRETGIKKDMDSSLNLLRGKIYEAMDNRNLAMDCFREALRQDIYCYEAFDLLVSHHMLSAQEERELLDSLPFSSQCPKEEVELVKYLYENKLKKYDKPQELRLPDSLSMLSENLDVVVNLAEREYYNCDFRECFKITSRVLGTDPYNSSCLPLHVAVLVELKKANQLFYLAHKLVDLYPNKPVSWFAVGCYYLVIHQIEPLKNKSEPARRYLSKATTLDRTYGPAWLAFGHSFAADNEHDQAMAAYFRASQLMKGCHLPSLYIGLEYGLTNNSKLAERFFSQALSIAPEDPFVLHEMGVIAFQSEDWHTAEKYFKEALSKVQSSGKEVMVEKWEPLLNNLGHTYRKLKRYSEALEFHQQARMLDPKNPSTYSAIGYCHVLMEDNITAVDYFHKALAIRRDDAFSTTMLGNVIETLMTELSPCEGTEDEAMPSYTVTRKLDMGPPKLDDTSDFGSPFIGTPKLDMAPSLAETLDDSSLADSSMLIQEVEMDESGS